MNVSEPDGTRYERGLARMKQIGGAHATEEFLAALADTAPELGRYVAEFIYGDLYERVGLGLKGRQLATIATLVALGGCERQLALHIKVALNLGIRAGTLTELFIHQSAYAGFPRALNAVAVLRDVLAAREDDTAPR
ncbi:carboxymuconolactone decarboxylase family protein [Streptomyces sp. NBC_00847]|uniref:carboxymuconolactone decarboxylase family protein n=1 Tax=unclassified Streptomyces TaxID=2593676 RepID=UPI002253F70D|nr:carboxymuconolactone decarboxylase family protein [Streptomyces sp. NBC_00847]MCX4881390.1 carboxymuconolactone decarboxylase family protein [Streptomyces sp. NBC_00847]